ncbi:MAG: hypothetical protein LBR92_00635 [Puniceicoccales bacterium]|jgi:hypothetical protein|nr:hypothetical protein [Puniceicoccales bacterium]
MNGLSRFQISFLLYFLGISISKASPSDISTKVDLQTPSVKIPRLNLSNEHTLATVTQKAIEFFLNPENASGHLANTPFIFSHYSLPKIIQDNLELKSKLEGIVEYLNNLPWETLENEDCPSKLYEMRPLLQEVHDLMVNNADVTADNAFAKFIQGSIKIINVIIADAVAKKVFQEIRSKAEGELSQTNTANSVSVEGSIGWGPFSLSLGGTLATKQGIGENSLYEISRSGDFSIGISAKASKDVLSISCQAGTTLTYTTLFHSIEQVLDSGQLKGTISEETSKKLSERSTLQNAEKQLLSVMGSDVEGFLKMIGIIPFNTYVKWPHLTKAEAPMTSIALDGKLAVSAEAKSFTQLGMKISKSFTGTIYRKSHSFLSLLNDDGRPADNLTAKDIRRIIGKKYDFSRKLLGSPIANANVLVPIYILSGDLRGYVSVIQELAALKQSKDSNLQELASLKKSRDAENIKKLKQDMKKLTQNMKELTKRKHAYESRLSPQHTFSSEGRLGVLKTYIVTAAMLSQYAKTIEEIVLCKKMFLELEKLESLLEFSKDKSSRSGTFIQKANYSLTTSGVSGTMKVDKCSITCDYNEYSNSPFLDENGAYLSFAITIPSSEIGSVAIQAIRDHISGRADKLTVLEIEDRVIDSVKHVAIDVLNWTETLKLIELETDLPSESPLKFGPSISGSTTISAQAIRIESNSQKRNSLTPLPGKELIVRNFPRLAIQFYTAGANVETGTKGKIEGLPTPTGITVGGKVSASHTTTSQFILKLGTSTISYILSRFNSWQMGVNESEGGVSAAWKAFKENNQGAFSEILKNIAKDGSKPLYELQGLYNDILKNVGTDTDEGKQCTELFGKLLENCEKFSAGEIDLPTVLDSFDKILEFNYEHNFLVHFNRAFSLHKKSKH